MKEQIVGRNRGTDTWDKVSQIRDKFEYDRERRTREKAFAPMNGGKNEPFDVSRNISDDDSD